TSSNDTRNTTVDTDVDLKLDAAATLRYWDSRSNTEVREDVQKTSSVSADERREKNNHGVDVNLEKDLRLGSDIQFSGDPTISGDITIDSAAIAVIDNRQSISGNNAENDLLENSASIADGVASRAAGIPGVTAAPRH